MTARDLINTEWRKSSRSTSEANCVEVAVTHEAIGVRDTKSRDQGLLTVTPRAWHAFLAAQQATD